MRESLLPGCKHAVSTALMQSTKGGISHQEAEGKRSAMNDRTLAAMGHAGVEACREIAEELEQQHPRWIVIFGTFTENSSAFPGLRYLRDLGSWRYTRKRRQTGCRSVERLCRVREGLSNWRPEERTGEA